MAEPETSPLAGRIAFTYPGFGLFLTARLFTVACVEMQSIAVGWQIFQITHKPFDLGLVGLMQFLPGILLFLVSGQTADRFPRRRVLIFCYAGYTVCAALLFLITLHGVRSVHQIYAVMVLLGIVRSFNVPATRAIVPEMVPEEHLPNAVAWGSSTFQAATILGPSIGGVIYAIANSALPVYATSMTLSAAAMVSMLGVNPISKLGRRAPVTAKTVLAGLRYVWQKKIVLGLISLDLFAVLLGGARRCFRRLLLKSCTQALGGSACCAARWESERLRWRFFSPIGRSAETRVPSCYGASPDLVSPRSCSVFHRICTSRWQL